MTEKLHERILHLQEQLRQGRIDRRDFLRYLTLLGVSIGAAEALAACAPKEAPTEAPPAAPTAAPPTQPTTAPPAPPPTAEPPPPAPVTQVAQSWGRELYEPPTAVAMIEAEDMKCTGCELCQQACSMKHFGVINRELSRIQVEQRHMPVPKGLTVTCANCQVEERECEKACPLTPPAIYYDNELFHMRVDEETCLGIKCNQCGEACTAGAIRWYEAVTPMPFVCDLCDTANDGTRDPECVKICPVTALHFRSPRDQQHDWRMSMDEKAELVARRLYPLTLDSYFDPGREI